MLDRQLLLEQKRQRLQELKQRRLNGPSEVDLLVDRLQNISKTKVNVAIQTDDEVKPAVAAVSSTKAQLTSVVTFDKAVQTVELWDDEPLQTNASEHTQDADALKETTEPVAEIHEPTRQEILQEQQLDGIFNSEVVSKSDGVFLDELPLLPSKIYSLTNSRSVVAVDIFSSGKPGEVEVLTETILVAYSAPPTAFKPSSSDQESTIQHSAGLAILFSESIPERFLLANSPIISITFDRGIHSRVVGGLQNGKIVVWELDNTNHHLLLFPLLVSPVLLSSASRMLKLSGNGSSTNSKTQYISHISPITSLLQSSKALVFSGSLDGVVNLWLTSILANPKARLVQLYQPVDVLLAEQKLLSSALRASSKQKLPITAMIQLERVAGSRGTISNDLDFLNSVIVGSQNGKLYKLCNDIESDYISAIGENDPRTIITSIVDFSAQHILVTTGLEFGFSVWFLAAGLIQKMLKVQMDHLIVRASARPGKKLQFVTIGYGKISTHKHNRYAIIQFWDLLVNAMKCIYQVEESIESMPMVAQFTPLGDRLLVGFENGELREWQVEDSVLEQIGISRTDGVDDGIHRIIARRKQAELDRN